MTTQKGIHGVGARKCAGCNKATGSLMAINRGYWHTRCWERASDDERERPRRERQRKHDEQRLAEADNKFIRQLRGDEPPDAA